MERPLQVVDPGVDERRGATRARVVDQDIEATERPDRLIDDARKLIDVVEIRGDGDGTTTRRLDLGGDRLHLGGGTSSDRHGGAGLREHARDGRTDATTAPGHEGDLALEREHVHFGALNDGI